MNITVRVSDLSRELGYLEKIVGKKPTIAVLSNVLIRASMGALLLSATDLEVGLIGACMADVDEPGDVTLPAKKLMDLVRAQSSDTVTITRDTKGVVKFKAGGFDSRLQALPPQDFPVMPSMDGLPSIVLPRQHVKRLIHQTLFAVSAKDKRYFLDGGLLVTTDSTLALVATDGARMARSLAPWSGTPLPASILIPSKALDELATLLQEEGGGDITFASTERHLFFDLDGRLLISRQVDGAFPAYERIIERDNPLVAVVDRFALATVLKRVILISDIVLLSTSPTGVEVSAVSADVGEGLEVVPVQYDGPKIDIRLRGELLLDFLNAAESASVQIRLKDALNPLLLVDGDYHYMMMGMRV